MYFTSSSVSFLLFSFIFASLYLAPSSFRKAFFSSFNSYFSASFKFFIRFSIELFSSYVSSVSASSSFSAFSKYFSVSFTSGSIPSNPAFLYASHFFIYSAALRALALYILFTYSLNLSVFPEDSISAVFISLRHLLISFISSLYFSFRYSPVPYRPFSVSYVPFQSIPSR